MTMVLLAFGGGIGAVLRWLATEMIPRPGSGFPLAITIVNVAGSLLLGLVVGFGAVLPGGVDPEIIAVGVLGGFTTYSTWMVDIDRAQTRTLAAITLGVPLVAGVAAAAAGVWVGAAFLA